MLLIFLCFLCLISSSYIYNNDNINELITQETQHNLLSLNDKVELPDNYKCAYVTLHYEGTDNDEEYILGIRVLIKSIKMTGTKYPVIVLVAENVSESSRQQFEELGAIIQEVSNIPNPYKEHLQARRSYKDRFEYTFNKLYLWSLTDYDRIIYMDADNVVLYNMDELFLCGHFCVIFMNMVYFHTGLIVVKPNIDKFNDLLTALKNVEVNSYDGADQGFLTAYFDQVEYSPLFRIEHLKRDINNINKVIEPYEYELMRLEMNYNLNQLYYHLDNNWNFLRYMGHYFSNYPIPALSIAYPITPIMKPWYWLPQIFFKPLYQPGNIYRSLLPNEDYWFNKWFINRIIYFIVMIVFIKTIYQPYILANHKLYKLRKYCVYNILHKLSISMITILSAIFALYMCFYSSISFICHNFIIQLVPAIYAWPITFNISFIIYLYHLNYYPMFIFFT